jgi:hypothetical protein
VCPDFFVWRYEDLRRGEVSESVESLKLGFRANRLDMIRVVDWVLCWIWSRSPGLTKPLGPYWTSGLALYRELHSSRQGL